MKIIFVVVCISLIQVLKASDLNEIESSAYDSDVIISRVVEGLSHVKSSKCKSDLNFTVNAFHERRQWAVGSKSEFQ